MGKLFHFGDSYGTVKYYGSNRNFCHHMAGIIRYDYTSFAAGGLSNEIIFRKILENIENYKDGDILFINFSFLSRGCFFDKTKKEIKSTNTLYNEIYDKKIYNKNAYNRILKENEGVLSLVEYYLNNSEDYNFRLFGLISPLFEYIISKGVSIFYIFAEESQYTDLLLTCGVNIKFKDGYVKWLMKNGFHNEEDIHYSVGVQPMLADVILRKTNNLSKGCESKIEITIEDVDYSKIEKPLKLL